MNPDNIDTPKPAGTMKTHESLVMPGEEMIAVVHRHPIGILMLYFEALVGIGAIIALAIIFAPDIKGGSSKGTFSILAALAIFAVAMLVFFLIIATHVYRQSKFILTDKSLVQTIQKGLFARKVSRLSMADIEDVTAEESGFLPTILNYGTLNIETAGELENFVFIYCPNPNKYAGMILDARQKYLEQSE